MNESRGNKRKRSADQRERGKEAKRGKYAENLDPNGDLLVAPSQDAGHTLLVSSQKMSDASEELKVLVSEAKSAASENTRTVHIPGVEFKPLRLLCRIIHRRNVKCPTSIDTLCGLAKLSRRYGCSGLVGPYYKDWLTEHLDKWDARGRDEILRLLELSYEFKYDRLFEFASAAAILVGHVRQLYEARDSELPANILCE
jgi:hypothetical protein